MKLAIIVMGMVLTAAVPLKGWSQVPGGRATRTPLELPAVGPYANAKAAFDAGYAYWEQRQYLEAASALTEATKLDPNMFEAFYDLGILLNHLRQTEKGMNALRRAIALRPDVTAAYIQLGQIIVQYPGSDKNEARQLALKAVELDPKSIDAHMLLGLVYFQAELDKDALEQWNAVLAIDPKNAEAYSNIGWLHSNNRRYPEAVAALTAAIALDPDRPDAYSTLCRAYLALEDYAAARRVLAELRRVNPADAEWIVDAIDRGEKLKRLAAAVKANPKDADAYFEIGMTYFNAPWQYKEAADAFRHVLAVRPRDTRARYYLGVCYVQDGKTEDANREAATLAGQDAALGEKLKARIAKGTQGITFGPDGIEYPE